MSKRFNNPGLAPESILATDSLNAHIRSRHKGSWGECEERKCRDTRYRIKYGSWPATPRHLTEQVDHEHNPYG
jgi:hypothetical protein